MKRNRKTSHLRSFLKWLLALGAIGAGFYYWMLPPVKKPRKQYPFAILLGCPCRQDGSMSRSQVERCKLAMAAWSSYRTLVITGGAVKNQWPEARTMAAYIESRCPIPVVIEDQSRTTWENLKNTRQIIGDVPVLLLTSSLHAPRAQAMARHFFSDVAVQTYRENRVKHVLREWVSRRIYMAMELRKLFQPEEE
ncbi:YdcF family protein [uncultured Faecalibaculum sp.]|uniref:YdcF family protein n=1 Tax=uncultured Faecalibaculum sp. TaxID=1729681 RepID=UPI0025E31D3C|nr:YdcF family protein [uncultured Faecalibaculum sp.]